MNKRGRPVPGEERKLTRAEVEVSRLDRGVTITTGIHTKALLLGRVEDANRRWRYTESEIYWARQRLEHYWSEDLGNGKELM